MSRKVWCSVLATLLVGIFLSTNITMALAAAKPKFSDVVGNPFRQQIEEITAAGLISGYPNGQFKPNTSISGKDGTITMLQLYITVIRGLGLENQAINYNLSNKSYKFSDTVSPQFRGYLALAADRNLLDAKYMANLRSDTAATRLNVATILATAFNIKSNSTNLNFVDQEQVKEPYYRSLIAGMVENGFMSGDTQGRFNFNNSMTREEYAVVLSRLLNKGLIKPQRSVVVNSQLVSFNNNSITVSENYNLNKAYSLVANCPVYLDNKPATLDQLVGKQISFYMDGNKVSYIKNYSSSSGYQPPVNNSNIIVTTKESGKLERVGLNNGQLEISITNNKGIQVTYKIGDNAKIYRNGKTIPLLELEAGEYVELELAGSVVNRINVEKADEYKGIITRVRNSSIRVEKSSRSDMDFSVDRDVVKVTKNGKKYDYDDLKTGYEVNIWYNKNEEALEIEVLDETIGDLEGEVRSIDYRDYEITINTRDGKTRYDVDEDVDVYGLVKRWRDIERDHYVKLELKKDKVIEIEVMDYDDGEFRGTVTDIDTRRDKITIEKSSGNEQTFDVGRKVDLEEIIIGSEVELTVRNGEVTDIDVIDDEDITVKGKITSLRSSRITIEQKNGSEFTFYLDRDVEVYDKRDREIDYDDLETKWEVELELKRGDVIEINVLYD